MSTWRALAVLAFGLAGVAFAALGDLVWALVMWACALAWALIRPRN